MSNVDKLLSSCYRAINSVYSQEARTVFSSLALLAPTSVLPRLLSTLATAAENPTQPHRFHVCIQAVAAVAEPVYARVRR